MMMAHTSFQGDEAPAVVSFTKGVTYSYINTYWSSSIHIINVSDFTSITYGDGVGWSYKNIYALTKDGVTRIDTNNDSATLKTVDISNYDLIYVEMASGSGSYKNINQRITLN